MIRLLIHLVVVGSLSLTFVGVQTRIERSIVALDLFGIAFAVLGMVQLVRAKWKLDAIAAGYLLFIGTLTLSAFINNTLLRGEFLNVIRTHVLGLVYYLYARHSRGFGKDYERMFVAIFICSAIYVPLSIQELNRIWGEGFRHYETMFGPLMNLNGWGFTWLLVFCVMLLGWGCTKGKKIRTACIVMVILSVVMVPVSLSRSAFIGLAAAVVIFSIVGFPRYRFVGLLIGALCILIFNLVVAYLSNGVDDSMMAFWTNKQTHIGEEIMDVRLQALTIDPITEAAQNGWGSIIVGGGLSTDHSIISHTFVSAGLIGLIALLVYHGIIFWQGTVLFRAARPASLKVARYAFGSLLAVTIVVFADDFAVNLRSYLPPVCLLFNLTLGLSIASLEACGKYDITSTAKPKLNARSSQSNFHRRVSAR